MFSVRIFFARGGEISGEFEVGWGVRSRFFDGGLLENLLVMESKSMKINDIFEIMRFLNLPPFKPTLFEVDLKIVQGEIDGRAQRGACTSLLCAAHLYPCHPRTRAPCFRPDHMPAQARIQL